MSTLRASASLSVACNGKGPFFMAPIHGMGISTSAVCSVSSFFNSKPCAAKRRAQSARQQNPAATERAFHTFIRDMAKEKMGRINLGVPMYLM